MLLSFSLFIALFSSIIELSFLFYRPLPKLMHLDISHSSIAVVEEEGFVGLDNLERLVLAGNVLKNVPKKFPL